MPFIICKLFGHEIHYTGKELAAKKLLTKTKLNQKHRKILTNDTNITLKRIGILAINGKLKDIKQKLNLLKYTVLLYS